MKEYKRNCPECGKELVYNRYSTFYATKKKNSSCGKCAAEKLKSWRSEMYKGKNGPFYGRHHTAESKAKAQENKDWSFSKTKEFAEKSARHGKDNGMYGKSIYDVWVKKYGKEEADKKKEELRKKRSINASGKGNPMYGKPSPKGSGNGWSGWYNGHFFRSLREFSYMFVLDKDKISWTTGEEKKYAIPYKDWEGKERTYFPDFIVDKNIIEIKPKKLMGSKGVQAKKAGALAFCEKNGYTYQLTDVEIIPPVEIYKLLDAGLMRFTEKYMKKFIEKYPKK